MPSDSITRRIHAIWQGKGLLSNALLPLAWITGRVVAGRRRRAHANPPPVFPLPTVVVGNLVVGGTGKTPVVVAIVQSLQAHGWHPGVISRGYGVRLGAQPLTGQGTLAADEFGDEPALIAGLTGAPIAVHPQRSLAREALVRDFPAVDVVISDDGLQHLALTRDFEVLVQDARGIGNGRLLPAGPLREPASKLAEVDVIIDNSAALPQAQATPQTAKATGHDGSSPVAAAQGDPPTIKDCPVRVTMVLRPVWMERLSTGERLEWPDWLAGHAGETLAAVAAIGQPERFFSMLRNEGLQLARSVALPDHDAYEHSPFTALREAVIVITAKDAVKCRRFADPRVWVVHVEPQFSDPAWLDHLHFRMQAEERSRKH